MDSEAAATQLRDALVDGLRDHDRFREPRIGQALRAVPRHRFLPVTVPLEQAYADDAVATKYDADGVPISSASQPAIVAIMLEQLDVRPGQRVLEIGAGTGYNAALLARLTGPAGGVTTIDVDRDLVDGARSNLDATGHRDVRVVLGDGALGYPPGAPYDRVVATVGVWDLPTPWLTQLAEGGKLLVPLRIRGSVARSIGFGRTGGRWRGGPSQQCGFMPLRGGVADPYRMVPLTTDRSVLLETHQEQDIDAAALAGVLERPGVELGTGVPVGPAESLEWLYLWLACALPNAVSRLTATPDAPGSGLVRPAPAPGPLGTVEGGSLAYVALLPSRSGSWRGARRAEPDRSKGPAPDRREIGVVGHGPDADRLAHRMADQVRLWARDHRAGTAEFELQPLSAAPATTSAAAPASGRFTLRTPTNLLAVTWR
ncbi:methyltransferase, FxLD system [Rugosimonospora africana]|uniref:Protein-L-isoaspartate O-methyltransferase n=1 Tax=Rugosimonospora africana TaxID=556532 RepID=A0A8J3QW04_9ACTN|nr:methyltransferase, FxLD system [Rugosimonospora africana]GIH15771.1 hypothetical protein Raf01_39430 [Rugosimonospora africana]